MSSVGDETSKQILASANAKAGPSTENRDRALMGAPPPAPFRMLLVSVLAAAIGLVAGLIAFALYKLIGFVHQHFFLPSLVRRFLQRAAQSPRLGGDYRSGYRRPHRRRNGEVWDIEN